MTESINSTYGVSVVEAIPKVIHYCWFGGNPLPERLIRCMDSWKAFCPDFEIRRWDENNYDVTKNAYMREAYEAKKWAFVSDYARLDIVCEHGGVYLDTDVELVRSIDDLLGNRAFMGFEDEVHVNPGLCLASVANNPTIRQLRDAIYGERRLRRDDGTLDLVPIPQLVTEVLASWGLLCNDELQVVRGITIYPSEYFCPRDYLTGRIHMTPNTYSVHWFDNSWSDPEHRSERLLAYRANELAEGKPPIVRRLADVAFAMAVVALKVKRSLRMRGVVGSLRYPLDKLKG